jgi:hypothetical protein
MGVNWKVRSVNGTAVRDEDGYPTKRAAHRRALELRAASPNKKGAIGRIAHTYIVDIGRGGK